MWSLLIFLVANFKQINCACDYWEYNWLNHYGCYGKGRQAPSGRYYCISSAGADLRLLFEKKRLKFSFEFSRNFTLFI